MAKLLLHKANFGSFQNISGASNINLGGVTVITGQGDGYNLRASDGQGGASVFVVDGTGAHGPAVADITRDRQLATKKYVDDNAGGGGSGGGVISGTDKEAAIYHASGNSVIRTSAATVEDSTGVSVWTMDYARANSLVSGTSHLQLASGTTLTGAQMGCRVLNLTANAEYGLPTLDSATMSGITYWVVFYDITGGGVSIYAADGQQIIGGNVINSANQIYHAANSQYDHVALGTVVTGTTAFWYIEGRKGTWTGTDR